MENEDEEMEPVQLVQMNTYQSNTHRKYLKLVSAILYQTFIFSPNHSPSNHNSNFDIFSSSFPHQIQKDKWKWNN